MSRNLKDDKIFSLLARPVRKALSELGFEEPTIPQKMAIAFVAKGENVLLIAPTGTGKTEAVLLPIFSKLIQQAKIQYLRTRAYWEERENKN